MEPGKYRLCAQAPASIWLNPCEWGRQNLIVTLSSAQRVTGFTVIMKKGIAVPIRIDDPAQVLAQQEDKTPGAHLLIGISSETFAFHPARIVSRDSGGRNQDVVIPLNSSVKISVFSPFFQLADAGGSPVALKRLSIPVAVAAGQQPPVIRLTVTGRR